MSEKITVSTFVGKYESSKTKADKVRVVKSVIERSYVPFIEKLAIIQAMLESAFVDRDGVKVPDAFCIHTNFYITVLSLYTSLDIERNDDNDKEAALRAYDMLQSCGIWEVLFDTIGSDYQELILVRDMYLANVKAENELTIQIARQVTRFGTLIGAALSPLSTMVQEELAKLSPEDLETIKSEMFKIVK